MTNQELSKLYDDNNARQVVRVQLLKTSGSTFYAQMIKGNLDVYTERLMKLVCADGSVVAAETPFDESGALLESFVPTIEYAANYILQDATKTELFL
jgi:hypothetical protein